MANTKTSEMTISEAADLLGVSSDASPADIQAAYRKQAKQYHPDAWTSATAQDKALAAKKYKKLNIAKKTLLNPSTARPEQKVVPQTKEFMPSSRNSYSYVPHVDESKPMKQKKQRPKQNINMASEASKSWAAVGNTTTEREKFNKAKQFTEQFGKQKDKFEESIADEYKRNSQKAYSRGTDIFKFCSNMAGDMAIAVTLMAITAIVIPLMLTGQDVTLGGAFPSSIVTNIIITFILVVAKLVVYDSIFAPSVLERGDQRDNYVAALAIGAVLSAIIWFLPQKILAPANIAVGVLVIALSAVSGIVDVTRIGSKKTSTPPENNPMSM